MAADPPAPSGAWRMSLAQFLRIFWTWRWLILVSALACAGAGGVAALTRARTYTATSRVLIDPQQVDALTGASTTSASFADALLPAQLQLIGDVRVAARVVDRLGLGRTPGPHGGTAPSAEERLALARNVAAATGAVGDPDGSIISISYTSDDPTDAAVVSNALRDAYIDETIAIRRAGAARSAAFFARQLVGLRGRLAAASQALADYGRQTGVVLLANDQDADLARLEALSRAKAQAMPVMRAPVAPAPDPAAAQLADLDARIAALATRLGPNHPDLLALRAQRAAAAAAVRTAALPPAAAVPAAGESLASARVRVLATRDKVATAYRLRSDVAAARAEYDKVAARLADLRQAAVSDDSGIAVLASATPPRKPDPPRDIAIVALDLAFGLILGALVALLVEFSHLRVRAVGDLEALGLPVLGTNVRVARSL